MNQVEVTGIDLAKFAMDVYELSVPKGLGMLHFAPGGLPRAEAEALVNLKSERCVLDMDYVKGRACKMHVSRHGDRLFINVPWYDHTNAQLQDLLSRHGLAMPAVGGHGTSCECEECRRLRRETPKN